MLIKNANIINSNGSFLKDIVMENGKIKSLEKPGSILNKADNQIDAEGMLVFPGGIDPHVHMHLPVPGGFSSDDFYTGSKAALSGGTTTIIDFVTPKRGQSIVEAYNLRKEEAKNCLVDFKFHVSPVEWIQNTEKEILYCTEKVGVKSFKVYMAYKNSIGLDDEDILKVMKVVGKAGGLVTVHAELGDEIEKFRNQIADNGQLTPNYHSLSRPPEMEARAVKRVLEMAQLSYCPVYIVHVSCKESIDYIKEAQLQGQLVYAETCPHYLLLDDSKYNENFDHTAPFVLSPPLRKKEDQAVLWDALQKDVIQTVGTDHCPFNLQQKKAGIRDFRLIPNGAGGVEHRLSLLYTYGVLQKKISLNQFVDLTSTKAAKIFGLYPQKGIIQPGSDADLILWNPEIKNTISANNHHMNSDNNIFEGLSTMGSPEFVICSGEIVYKRNGGLINKKRRGQFLN